jgi:predicted CopG family antitoxin
MSKTIEIDDDAYDRLEKARRTREGWSDLIRGCVRIPRSSEEALESLCKADVSLETMEAIDESVTRRRQAVPTRTEGWMAVTDTVLLTDFGEMVGRLQRAGQAIGDMDALIASVALEQDELLFTRNTAHFERVSGLWVQSY